MRIGGQPVNSSTIIRGLTGATGLPTLSLASSSQLNWNGDTILARDAAANVLRMANGASAQSFRLYNTRTDASNYERLDMGWGSNQFVIETRGAGTGTGNRLLRLTGAGTTLDFSVAGSIDMYRNGSSIQTLLNVTSTGLTSTALLFARLTPSINQASGTYTVLDINPTETAVGAGPHYLIRGRIGAGGNVFTVDNAGAIAIGNTVNAVSPTSPNRTITMVIGGTTYYLHAKTTND